MEQRNARDFRYAAIKMPKPGNPHWPKWVKDPSGKDVLVNNPEEEMRVTETPEQTTARLEREQIESAQRLQTLTIQLEASKKLLATPPAPPKKAA